MTRKSKELNIIYQKKNIHSSIFTYLQIFLQDQSKIRNIKHTIGMKRMN